MFRLKRFLFSPKSFELFQRLGINLTANHFYSPIPEARSLRENENIWGEQRLPGIDLNISEQVRLLNDVFPKFESEYQFPLKKTPVAHEYYITNGAFGLASAGVLHAMIRYHSPQTVIEVGSGSSTYVSARALRMNAEQGRPGKLVSIEPYPNDVLRRGFPGLSQLISRKVEEVDSAMFSQLRQNDILFIDSSHVVRMGGDVNFLFLEVLPTLAEGVLIHIHDIFFPYQYPKEWVLSQHRFWTEQYLLQALLIGNNQFEVLWCGSFMYSRYGNRLKEVFPPPDGLGSGKDYFSSSFWMKKVT